MSHKEWIIRSFSEINSSDFFDQLKAKLRNDIESKGKAYILSVDEEEYKSYLAEKYSLAPLEIDFNNEIIEEPSLTFEWYEDKFHGIRRKIEVYNFTIKYSFTGSCELFRVRPSQYLVTSAEIFVSEHNNTVSFRFKLDKQEPAEFNRTKADFQRSAFANLKNTNQAASDWNQLIFKTIASIFNDIKSKYLKENDFFTAINVRVNNDTSSVFSAPMIKKRVIPQPLVPQNREFASEPIMATEMYHDVLKVIYDVGKNMEKKPSTYLGKDEEAIRDQFLLFLETRYEGITATGETFNKGGKTDIILKYANDGSNLFVAECKYWHGASELKGAISQLFDRYLTWRDSKVALLLFVNNIDFTNVLGVIQREVIKHKYYKKSVGKRGDTSFSYEFHLPQDVEKPVFLEVLAFHFLR